MEQDNRFIELWPCQRRHAGGYDWFQYVSLQCSSASQNREMGVLIISEKMDFMPEEFYTRPKREACSRVYLAKGRLFNNQKGENVMDYSVIADWFTILFFLWFGLKRFIPALDKRYFSALAAIIALLAAVFTALST